VEIVEREFRGNGERGKDWGRELRGNGEII
jgi:hypothetical protein